MMVTPTRKATPELQALCNLFYASLEELGQFSEVDASEMPDTARKLLWHDEHMTETVEAFHGTPVDVSVLEMNKTPTHYARRILLNRKTDGKVVQFGIVRLSVDSLADDDSLTWYTSEITSPFNGLDIAIGDGECVVEKCGDCPTDADGNGETKAPDLAFLLGNWGDLPPDAAPNLVCLDSDDSGDIKAPDLAVLLGNWGDCP